MNLNKLKRITCRVIFNFVDFNFQAMLSGGEDSHSHTHDYDHDHGHDTHSDNMWKGLVASLGVVFFFFTEKCLTLCAEWRKRHQRKSRVSVL